MARAFALSVLKSPRINALSVPSDTILSEPSPSTTLATEPAPEPDISLYWKSPVKMFPVPPEFVYTGSLNVSVNVVNVTWEAALISTGAALSAGVTPAGSSTTQPELSRALRLVFTVICTSGVSPVSELPPSVNII